MKRLLPAAIFISILVVLAQFARTSNPSYTQMEAAEIGHSNQFRLKQSYALQRENHDLLATVYSCGTGAKQKEVLSIWSREADAYELQYIRTASAGEAFMKPEIFSIEEMSFVKISIQDEQSNPVMVTMLSVTPERTLHEVPARQATELIKIHHKES